MAKKDYLHRYFLIIKKISQNNYPNYEDLVNYVTHNAYLKEQENLQVKFSKRTLNRDLIEIRSIFSVDILYSKKEKGYYIASENYSKSNFIEMLETLEVLKLSQFQNEIENIVIFEQKHPKGTEHLKPIILAIRKRKKIIIEYEKYWDGTIRDYFIEPYALKEMQNRWYLIAKNIDGKLSPYAIDRIRKVELDESTDFIIPDSFDITKLYQNNYGISIDKDLKPEKILFSTNNTQAKYIKSLPIHHSQKIIYEEGNKVTFQLNIKLGDELVYKILSYGGRITIEQPTELINIIKEKLNILNKSYGKDI